MTEALLHLTNGYQSGEEACPLATSGTPVTRVPVRSDGPLALPKGKCFSTLWLPFTLNCIPRPQVEALIPQLAAACADQATVLCWTSDALLGGMQLLYGVYGGPVELTEPARTSDQLLCGMEGEYLTHMAPDQWGRLFLKQGFRCINVDRRAGKIVTRAVWKPAKLQPLDDKIRLTDGYDQTLYAQPGHADRLEAPARTWKLDGQEQR